MRHAKSAKLLLASLTAFLSMGCSFLGFRDSNDDEKMTISVDFQEVHLCSRISPEITVAYAPKGTKFYDVRLMEYGIPERLLGGGVWREDGSGIIPEGALTRHYTGPCPKENQITRYAYIVSAMSDETNQPLEVRLFHITPGE